MLLFQRISLSSGLTAFCGILEFVLQSGARNRCFTTRACITCERLRKHRSILLSLFSVTFPCGCFFSRGYKIHGFNFPSSYQNSGEKILPLTGDTGSVSVCNVLFAGR